MEIEISDFTGCKIASFCGDRLWPSYVMIRQAFLAQYVGTAQWGREGMKVLWVRGAWSFEELGIHLTEDCLLWSKVYPSMLFGDKQSVFLVGKQTQNSLTSDFGDEGRDISWWALRNFCSVQGCTLSCRIGWGIIWRNIYDKTWTSREQRIWRPSLVIQRASFKAVYDKYQDEYDPYSEDSERIKWKLVERPNSYYYFVERKRR